MAANPFQIALDSNFETLGHDAVYTPDVGEAINIKVMPRRNDEFLDLGESSIQSNGALFDVRASELPSPEIGATVEYLEQNYIVQSTSAPDGDRLLWVLDCYKE